MDNINIQLNNPGFKSHHLMNLTLEFEPADPLIQLRSKLPVEAIDGIVLQLIAVIHLHDINLLIHHFLECAKLILILIIQRLVRIRRVDIVTRRLAKAVIACIGEAARPLIIKDLVGVPKGELFRIIS